MTTYAAVPDYRHSENKCSQYLYETSPLQIAQIVTEQVCKEVSYIFRQSQRLYLITATYVTCQVGIVRSLCQSQDM